ncbi:tryptophan-rich sensory protein [Corynebacterium uterequi]|uniref:TspO and MBR related protein n=1 Tax=Corynebacterium uterequi TaxID=1072256 RepID=A0A0G3HAG7_9CORY|nr:tryptophan-rich sensory protein [Corynebacterium uterequi]AKK10366.1 TspO and MBR related protein [Corynebacterium uterequi]
MSTDTESRLGLVTGATGYVGSNVAEELLNQGWAVRVLSRSRDNAIDEPWGERIVAEGQRAGAGEVEVVEGDANSRDDVAAALTGVEVAWYLLHSMSEDDFVAEEREMATIFAEKARKAGVKRIVYLGGLHPEGEELSDHLASRVAVGEILMGSGVPTAALQAGVVLGEGSASFSMLRHLSERLPGAIGPQWIRNKITPIAVDDAVFFLTKAADLPEEQNRTFDIGGPESLEYAEMMKRYARVLELGPRPVVTAPVTTPGLAAHWISLITPTSATLASPLIGSLLHDTVVKERDLEDLVGTPAGGLTGFDEAVRNATKDVDTRRFYKVGGAVGGAVAIAAAAGTALVKTDSLWYKMSRRPSWQPSPALFPIVWTALYTDIAVMSALHVADAIEAGDRAKVRSYGAALGTNLVLNAGWCGLFFRARRRWLSAAGAAALAASSIDLVRRLAKDAPERGVLLSPYAAWTSFATVLSATIAKLN